VKKKREKNVNNRKKSYFNVFPVFIYTKKKLYQAQWKKINRLANVLGKNLLFCCNKTRDACSFAGHCLLTDAIDRSAFQVSCMQFINIVVHSVEDMNYRVHLQHEFTLLGLDEYLEVRCVFLT